MNNVRDNFLPSIVNFISQYQWQETELPGAIRFYMKAKESPSILSVAAEK